MPSVRRRVLPRTAARRLAWLSGWGIAWALAPLAVLHGQELELVGFIPGPATVVSVHGDRAYLGDGPTLRIVDIADPAAPAATGSVTLPENIYDIDVSGAVAYAAIDFGGLATVDVSDPAAPRLLATFRTPGQALSIAVAGTTAAVTNRLSGLEVIGVSDPAAPAASGSYFAEGYAIAVAVAGARAYVIDTPGGLSIVDLTETGEELAARGSLATREMSAAVAAGTLSRNGSETTLAALMSSESTLELVDVSDPAAPTSLGTYRDAGRPGTGGYIGATATGGLVHVELEGSLAFLADAYPPFLLQVVDISDPAAPTLVTEYEPPGPPRDLAVAGPLVLLATGGAEMGGTGEPGVLILRQVTVTP